MKSFKAFYDGDDIMKKYFRKRTNNHIKVV